ncbi:MAG TPA: hypothetical protein VGE41_14000, partial [Verrucomicrobiae bacterium]
MERPFPGLRTNLVQTSTGGGRLRLLIVHGMSTHTQGYSSNFVETIAKKLKLNCVSSQLVSLTNSAGETNGFLATSDYQASTNRLRAYELTWSPVTWAEKTNQFALDSQLDRKRGHLNKQLKSDLLNDGFGDAVLYLSTGFKPKMQEPVTNAILRILADGFTIHDQFIIITHSLGSKLTFDSFNSVARSLANSSKSEAQAITNLAAQTTYMIMLANQIPLLRLGETNAAPGLIINGNKQIKQFLDMRQQGL